jgi:phage RecT family recombinase
MSDEPPDWVSHGPPPDPRAVANQAKGKSFQRRDAATPAQEQAMQQAFNVWLDQPDTKHKIAEFLPDYITLPTFVQTAKTAVQNNPALLEERYLPGLMAGVLKAAEMGIPPDGRLGALIPRWDNNAHRVRIVFQPMYHGLLLLGRRTGAIREINTGIVFRGERLILVGGDEPKLEHYPDPELIEEAYAAMNVRKVDKRVVADVEAFLDRVVIAYCVIVGSDGTKHRAWIPRSRLQAIRLGAADGGPWNGPFLDEMMKKSTIFLASKMIDLDLANPYTQRFRSAVMDGLEQNFIEHEPVTSGPATAALEAPSPTDKLRTLEDRFGVEREPVAAPETPAEVVTAPAAPEAKERASVATERRPARSGDAPMTAPRLEVDKQALFFRDRIERLPTLARWKEFSDNPRFAKWLVDIAEDFPKIREEVLDALAEKQRALSEGEPP